ncbi:MAG: hypothetical protein Sapg2KO_04830 [Saprospiraceae bacterium]
MKRMINLTLLLLIIAILPGFAKTEQVGFEILMKGKSIGNIKAQRIINQDKTVYKVTSKASFRVIVKYVRETIAEVIFSGGKIQLSDAKQIMNQQLKEHRVTEWNGATYACKQGKNAPQASFKKPIKLCTSMLYFQEPVGQAFIFAENYQELCPVELIQPGVYKVTLPQGKINHYIYKNGQLEEIKVFRTMVNLVFKRTA